MTHTYDVIIIGGGASGSYCAIHAAARGLRVCLLEHNRDIGAKIRVSGGGRCNYTNLHLSAEAYHGHNPTFVRSALARHNQWQVLDWFAARGITAEEKHQGQIFAAERARGILTALHDGLATGGVHLHHHIAIHSQHYDGDCYRVETSHGDFRAPQLVIACGGPSYPKLGASDYALRVAKQYGIRNYPFRPALVPLTLATPPVGLVGISHEVSITTAGAPSFRDDLLYTHRGISGPAVLQISSYRQKDAPILILDEATSALDSEVEAAIQQSLNQLMQGKTVIAIAHRLSTIAAMDRLIILDGGRIVEQGSHDELLQKNGIYAQLWARQTGGYLGEAE